MSSCCQTCPSSWSSDGKFFNVSVRGATSVVGAYGEGRTLVIPLPPGKSLPELPPAGIPLDSDWPGPPGTKVLLWNNLAVGPEASVYAYVKADIQRNLFRIPLH